MKPFADRLVREIGQGNTVTLAKASTFLRGLPNFVAKTREAELNQKSVIATTLRLFPEAFQVRTSKQGGAATLEIKRDAPRTRLRRLAG